MPIPDRARLLDAIAETCVAAGRAIMAVYATEFEVETKGDASPVTAADAAAEAIILADLARLLPDVPVVAEEEVSAGRVPAVGHAFLLVDPLDGTREFVQRNGDFTVNVALVEAGAPTLGVVFAPVERRLWAGDATAGVAWSATVDEDDAIGALQPIAVRAPGAAGVVAVASRSHGSGATERYLAEFEVAERLSRGSSLKICMVACGQADLYPRLAPTCEWDIAAGDAVLRAAGGRLDGPDGTAMRYGKPGFRNTAFVAAGRLAAPPLAAFLADD